jgi:hypothetical protein
VHPSIVLNRKNALFAPCIASLIETCKLNGLDPQAYFTDVPWAWAAEHLINNSRPDATAGQKIKPSGPWDQKAAYDQRRRLRVSAHHRGA